MTKKRCLHKLGASVAAGKAIVLPTWYKGAAVADENALYLR